MTKNFTVSLTSQFTRNNIKDHAYWTEWIIEMCNRMPAIYEIKNPDGTYNYPSGSNSNSLERLETGGYRRSVNDDMSGTISADWQIIKGLKLSFSGGARYLNNNTHENRMASDNPLSGDKENHISESFNRNTKYTATAMLSYNTVIKERHTLGVLAGYGYEGEHANYFGTTRVTDNHDFDVMVGNINGTDKLPISNYSGASDWSLYSFFARVNYNYAEKYLLEFNLRNDYSSYFAKGNRSGLFPSLSAGWRISQESFWDNIRPYVSSLKLRGSWGLVGNNRIGAYQYLQSVSVSQ